MLTLIKRVRAIGCRQPIPIRKSSRSLGAIVRLAGYTCVTLFGLFAVEASGSRFVQLDYNLTLQGRSRDTVFIEVFDDKPVTSDNFLQYVNAGKYDDTVMHRLARNFVIQGGGFKHEFIDEPHENVEIALNPDARVDLDGDPDTPNPTIVNEYSLPPVRSNLRGTIAMARIGGQPNSATNQWFVNFGNNSGLDNVDGGFTVFGRVVGDGMTLLDAFNTLNIINLNPDVNDDGVRDGGPFYNGLTDGVPALPNSSGFNLVVLESAKQIDYYGNGFTMELGAGGLKVSARDAFIDTGAVFTGTGPLVIEAGHRLGIREGFVVDGHTIVNRGTLAPGLQLGSISMVDGNYYQFDGATFEVQLRGTTPDTEFDRFVTTGAAFLAGNLKLELISGFEPEAGDSFTVLAAASWITGNFTGVELPMLTPGLVWNYDRSLTAITLSVAAADFNKDGIVDAGDYVMWRKTDGTAEGYQLWRENLGNIRGTISEGAGSASAAVPEPGAALLLLSAGVLLATRRRRRP